VVVKIGVARGVRLRALVTPISLRKLLPSFFWVRDDGADIGTRAIISVRATLFHAWLSLIVPCGLKQNVASKLGNLYQIAGVTFQNTVSPSTADAGQGGV
jgi:hypothetical protein